LPQIFISGMLVVEASLTYHSFINTSVSGSNSETIVQCFVHHSISDFICLSASKQTSSALLARNLLVWEV